MMLVVLLILVLVAFAYSIIHSSAGGIKVVVYGCLSTFLGIVLVCESSQIAYISEDKSYMYVTNYFTHAEDGHIYPIKYVWDSVENTYTTGEYSVRRTTYTKDASVKLSIEELKTYTNVQTVSEHILTREIVLMNMNLNK